MHCVGHGVEGAVVDCHEACGCIGMHSNRVGDEHLVGYHVSILGMEQGEREKKELTGDVNDAEQGSCVIDDDWHRPTASVIPL